MAPSFFWLLGLLVVVAISRIVELNLSKSHRKKREAQQGNRLLKEHRSTEAAVRSHDPIYPLMVLLHTSVFIVVPLEVILLERPFDVRLAAVCLVVLFCTAGTRFWVIRTLSHNWNVEVVIPEEVCVDGPYRYIRHPNYAIVILELIAIPLFHQAYLSAAVLTCLNAIVLWKRIRDEEAMLFQQAGYRNHFRDKARFIPGVF